jgi:hypothetical protein
MVATVMRGALAGAAGTTALNAVTYADMAVRGRPSSPTPEQAVETLAGKAGLSVPGSGDTRGNRLTGLGALSGIAVGVGVGAALGLVHAGLRRIGAGLPWWAAGALTGAAAMAATDLPMGGLGVTDPGQWSASDWLSDVLPHLAYGAVTYGALALTDRSTTGRRAAGRVRPAPRGRPQG